MFLFDTDVITNILKKKPSKKLLTKLSRLNRSKQFISTITIGEIVYGAFKSSKVDYHLDNLKNILLPSINILPFDSKSSFIYGKIRAELEKKGKSLSHCDLQIASITIANNLTLVTGNINHFKGVPWLKVENWIS